MAKRQVEMSDRHFKKSRDRNNYKYHSPPVDDLQINNSTERYKQGSVCKRTEIIRDGRKFPLFQKPSVIGVFSLDSDRRFLPNECQLKYLFWNQSPVGDTKVNFDLNDGIDSCVRKNELIDEKLDNIFQWLKIEGNQSEECKNADFVCYRGLLTTIMSSPYERQEGWIICATKLKNTIYLCAFDTPKKKRDKENVTEKLKQFQSWGFKFEQYLLAEEPGQEPDTSKPVIETEELACVFRTKLNHHRIVYVAEMDGVISDEPVSAEDLKTKTVPFVELKTSRFIETQRQDTNFKRFKLLKWWCQSFLVGIENILCGFRDDDGIVSSVRDYKVKELPKMAKGFWDSCVCMNFCAQFLDFVKSCVNESTSGRGLWKFEWNPGNSIMAQEIDTFSEFHFVPDWYTDL